MRHNDTDLKTIDGSPRRTEWVVTRFGLKSLLMATVMASIGAAAFTAGYHLVALVAVALTVAAFIAFAPAPGGDGLRGSWWRWLLTFLAGGVWGAVIGLILGAAAWSAWPGAAGSWKLIYVFVLSGAVAGLILARPINGFFGIIFRLLKVFLPG